MRLELFSDLLLPGVEEDCWHSDRARTPSSSSWHSSNNTANICEIGEEGAGMGGWGQRMRPLFRDTTLKLARHKSVHSHKNKMNTRKIVQSKPLHKKYLKYCKFILP